jgi:hypothetical protein
MAVIHTIRDQILSATSGVGLVEQRGVVDAWTNRDWRVHISRAITIVNDYRKHNLRVQAVAAHFAPQSKRPGAAALLAASEAPAYTEMLTSFFLSFKPRKPV